MKLLAFSDLHRDLDTAADLVERSSDADLVIGAGDFGSVHEGVAETIAALAPISVPTLLVPCNNETEDELRAAVADAGWSAAEILHGSGTSVDGLEFFGLGAGVPTTPWDWSFDPSSRTSSSLIRIRLNWLSRARTSSVASRSCRALVVRVFRLDDTKSASRLGSLMLPAIVVRSSDSTGDNCTTC